MRQRHPYPDSSGAWISSPRISRSLHRLILVLRLGAILIAAGLLAIVLPIMAALPWEIDSMIALAAALAWAYVFERGEG